MIRSKLLYAFGLITLSMFTLMFEDDLGIILVISLLFSALFLKISLMITYHKMSISIAAPSPVSMDKQPTGYELHLTNKSIIPLSLCIVWIQITNKMDSSFSTIKLKTFVPGKGTSILKESFTPPGYGQYEFHIKKIIYYDILRIFHKKKKPDCAGHITSMPSALPIECIIPFTDESGDECDVFSKIKKGDDPSEIFQIRAFSEGDSLRQIHWKLSSKMDTLIVRDNSLPISKNISLYVELFKSRNHKEKDLLEEAISTLISLSSELIHQQVPHKLYWFCLSQESITEEQITSEDDLYYAMGQFLSEPLPSEDILNKLIFDYEPSHIIITAKEKVIISGNGGLYEA